MALIESDIPRPDRPGSAALRRLQALQQMTSRFSGALTSREVADVIGEECALAMGSSGALVYLLVPEGDAIEVVAGSGFFEQHMPDYRRVPLDTPLAITEVVRTGEAVLLESSHQREQRYPYFRGRGFVHEASAVLPLVAGSYVLGTIVLSYEHVHAFDADEREFMQLVSHQCAQAMRRAQLFEAERSAHVRALRMQRHLSFLAESSRMFATSLDVRETLGALAQLAVTELRISNWCTVYMGPTGTHMARAAVAHRNERNAAELLEAIQEAKVPSLQPVLEAMATATTQRIDSLEPFLRDVIDDAPEPWRTTLVGYAPTFQATIVVPIVSRDKAIGAIHFARSTPGDVFGEEERELAEELARRAAFAIELEESRARERAVEKHLYDVEERQRLELATRLHDGPIQLLAASLMFLDPLPQDPAVPQRWRRGLEVLRDALEATRLCLRELHPILLGELDLEDGLERLVLRVQPEAEVRVELPDGFTRDQPELAVQLYRCAQELVRNAEKHAAGAIERLELRLDGQALRLEVVDSGPGFDLAAVSSDRFGLHSLRHRAELAGGSMGVDTSAGGTRVWMTVPIADEPVHTAAAPAGDLTAGLA